MSRLPKWLIPVIAIVAVAVIVLIILVSSDRGYDSIQLKKFSGNVTVSHESNERVKAYESMLFTSGDTIEVASDSYARLKLDDSKYILLDADTIVDITSSGSEKSSHMSIDLKQGSIINEIQAPLSSGSSYEINTPNATMSVRGTVFQVTLITEGNQQFVDVMVTDGEVLCTTFYIDSEGNRIEEGSCSVTADTGLELTITTSEDGSVTFKEETYTLTPEDILTSEAAYEFYSEASPKDSSLSFSVEELTNAYQELTQPAVPTELPTAAPTATATPIPSPTVLPTATPTATPIPSPTVLPTATPTATPIPSPTVLPTATPTATPIPSPTVLPTATPTATPIPSPTVLPTATPTATPAPELTSAPVQGQNHLSLSVNHGNRWHRGDDLVLVITSFSFNEIRDWSVRLEKSEFTISSVSENYILKEYDTYYLILPSTEDANLLTFFEIQDIGLTCSDYSNPFTCTVYYMLDGTYYEAIF